MQTIVEMALVLILTFTVLVLAVPDMVYGSTEDGSVREAQEDNQCPDWLNPNNTQPCQCASEVLHCNSSTQEAAILDCYCMTASESNNVEVGKCIFNCEHRHSRIDTVYTELKDNISAVTSQFCDDFNRQGRLCGECKDDHYPPSYSYSLKCIKCKGHYHWLIYITVAFVPLTIFFILVVCLRISATSPQLNGYVVVAQFFTAPATLRVTLLAFEEHKTATLLVSAVTSLYGIWNLDFFRMLIPDICLHMNTLQALAVDYIVAVYPLVLIALCYTVLQFNYRFILWILRPFHVCSTRIRNQIDARTSLIDAFATFLLLSYVKLLSVSFDLLVPVQVFNATGHKIGLYLYYDASVEYFGKQHLPYAITALAVVLVFILLPLLLLMAFPMRCFQRLLGKCGIQFQVLRTFMDSFQGCYKDGTNGTRDFRYFPAVYLLLRVFLFVMYASTLNETSFGIAALTFITLGIAIFTAQPYKQHMSKYNTVEAMLISMVGMWLVSVMLLITVQLKANFYFETVFTFSIIMATLPLVYISTVAVRWILTREKMQTLAKKILNFRKRNQYEEIEGDNSFLEGIDQRNELNIGAI